MPDPVPNLLRSVCKHVGLTPKMLMKIMGVKEEPLMFRMLEEDSQIGLISKLFRSLNVRITIPNEPAKKISFHKAALNRVFHSEAWRKKHDLLPIPKDVDHLRTIARKLYRTKSARACAADMQSQLIPGPPTWNEKTVFVVTSGGPFKLNDQWSDTDRARFVVVREITVEFPSPKFTEYVTLDFESDPVVFTINPAPLLIQDLLIKAALSIEGFVVVKGEATMHDADAGETDESP